ncbi:conserved hypothetical protein [Luminiphilus syltensis NOR5-1B]|uniref:Lipoprotein n=1 Tax=Luminiphilus syltensis NOR5-1B TaxID=565045 RepID=B8KSJ9_9GAMM|nr:DUF3313 family protein [Luminiphilus syltensis]EED36818.1 conserved hypothetical protein [Luminiphilus syltensis NOR5-1B]
MIFLRRTFIAFGTAAILILMGCAGEPTIQTGEDAEVLMGNLNRVDNARSGLAYVDPEADYARYQRVLIQPLNLDNVEIVQPSSSGTLNRYNREWELTDSDKAALQSAYLEVMTREISEKGEFAIADTNGDDVLIISAMITRIAPSAPKEDMASRSSARGRVYTDGAGSISIAIAFMDGDSGEIVALIKDARRGDHNIWGINNSVTNMAEVRRAFGSWAMRINDGLLALKSRDEG